jgi:hypothetical protein
VIAMLAGAMLANLTTLVSTIWNACGILYLGIWTHTASASENSYGYIYSGVAIVLFCDDKFL